MRFKLTLTSSGSQNLLPMNYQYYISAWIYRVLKSADEAFATFLHEKGYGIGDSKLYKLFCFSRLEFGKPKLLKEKQLFELSCKQIHLQISFDIPEAATNFIKGLFASNSFYLGDRNNGIDFMVTGIEASSPPDFKTTLNYSLSTPWVVSIKEEGSKHARFIYPDSPEFVTCATKHIREKYVSTRLQDPGLITLKPSTPFKRSGYLIKPGTAEETRIVGSLFDFELTAPIDVHQMVWSAGICEKSSNGFGWIEVKSI